MKKKNIEIILLALLYFCVLFAWTRPINEMPFGDVDSSTHFTSGDWMGQNDKAIWKVPYYMNSIILNETSQGYLGYPPQFNTIEAISQIVGGHRIISPYIIIALLCSIIVLSSYFLIRNLYGFWPAFLSSLLLGFSTRDYMVYLWAQWPQAVSYAFIPIVVYAYYKYVEAYLGKEKHSWRYFIIVSVLLATQYMMHPMGIFISGAILFIYSLILLFKDKKIPFNIKHCIALITLFFIIVIVLAPLQFRVFLGSLGVIDIGLYGGGEKGGVSAIKLQHLGDLFSWSKIPENLAGVPASYYTYSGSHGGYWTLPLLILGLLVVFTRRERKDLLMISWLITLYIAIHIGVLNLPKAHRLLASEAYLFYPLIGIALIAIPSLINVKEPYKRYLKTGLIIIFILLAINFNAKPAYDTLSVAYAGIGRITPIQYEAADWIRNNLPEKAMIYQTGTPFLAKKKWIRALSFRTINYNVSLVPDLNLEGFEYVLLDYSDLSILSSDPHIKEIISFHQKWEQDNLADKPVLYNKNHIKVYAIE